MQEQFPEEDSDIAREGTAMHDAVAYILRNDEGVTTAHDLCDRKMPNGVYITDKMVDDINLAVNYVRGLGLPENELLIETEIVREGFPYEGTPDIHHFSPITRTLHIVDHKFGYIAVEAIENKQMTTYAHLILAGLPPGSIDKIVMHIVQPRAWHPLGKTRTWEIDFDDLWNNHITPVYQAAIRDGDCLAGLHCAHCSALAHCKAARISASHAFAVSSKAVLEDMPGEALSAELELMETAAKMIKLRKEAIEKLAIERIKSGVTVPDYALQNSHGKRKYKDGYDLATMKAFGEAVGVKFVEETLITPAEAERRNVDQAVIDMCTYTPITGQKLSKTSPQIIMERMKNGSK